MPGKRSGATSAKVRTPRRLSHLRRDGAARMVDVSDKPVTRREAVASAEVRIGKKTLAMITSGGLPKGDVFSIARLAGITAAKRTAELIPLCHPLPLNSIEVDIVAKPPGSVMITASVVVIARTGAEMEALTAVSAASLTVYDMCKAVSRNAVIGPIRLERKTGGQSGSYVRSGSRGPGRLPGGEGRHDG